VDRYREQAPALDPYRLLARVWSRLTAAVPSGPQIARVVPDACMDLIWHRESGRLFIAGPDTVPHVSPIGPGTLIGLRFSPGAAPAALGLRGDLLRDTRVGLDAVWSSAETRRLADTLAATDSDRAAQEVLQRSVTARFGGDRDPVVAAVLGMLRSGVRVGAVAAEIGLSERQLHRRCLAAFGYGPKVLHRVLRFDRARLLARQGLPFADIAYRTGYADQAHLAREVKALGGIPLGQFT
jgi:AraC-like DNA-binding protein